MFNSQKINNDPHPYVIDGTRSWVEPGLRRTFEQAHDPRARFNNSPNPILEAFRTSREHSVTESTVQEHAADWAAQISSGHGRAEHVEHARKVLHRLAAS